MGRLATESLTSPGQRILTVRPFLTPYSYIRQEGCLWFESAREHECELKRCAVWELFESSHVSKDFTGRWAMDKRVWRQSWLSTRLCSCCCCACLRSWPQGCKFLLHQCDKASRPFVALPSPQETKNTSVHQCLSDINICGSFHGGEGKKMFLTHLWCLGTTWERGKDISHDNATHQHLHTEVQIQFPSV